MKFFSELKKEIKKTTSSTYLKIVIIAVMLVPLFYGALYLKAFWDPYEKMDQVPIALVNLDKGYDNNGKSINIGNELVSKLKTNNNLKWEFVDKTTADNGLKQKKYYASLTIPENFSANTYSVDGSNPVNAKLIYKSREATNYLATTITNQVALRVTDALSHEIIGKYFDNIFINLKNTANGLVQAADASTQLSNGLITASNGASSLYLGLGSANTGSSQLVDGLTALNANQTNLTNGLKTAVTGTNSLKIGAKNVYDGLDQTKNGLNGVSSNIKTIQDGITANQNGLSTASSSINQYITAHPGSESDIDLNTALATISFVNGSNGLTKVNQSLALVNAGVSQLSTGADSLKSGQSQIISGLSLMESKLQIAKEGSSSLAEGSTKLLSGATTLSKGLTTLSNGAGTLSTGLVVAKDGMAQLSDSLVAGADKAVASTDDKKIASETAVMASPVTMTNNSYDLVANYGSGFAPYFISLALWVGGLLSFFAIDFDKKPQSKTVAIVKYAVLAVIGVVQAVALALVLQHVLGLSVANPVLYYGFTILMSLTFMALLQLLVQHMGNGGRYIAIILLILQLASAAGTFPKETLPMFFQVINPFLPMTYSVMGIKDILFTNELANLWVPILYFIGVMIASLAINIFMTKKKQIVKTA